MLTKTERYPSSRLRIPTIKQAEEIGFCKTCVCYHPERSPCDLRGRCSGATTQERNLCGRKGVAMAFKFANEKRWSAYDPEKEVTK